MSNAARRPAIALVDDDFHSARLMTRTLITQGAPSVDQHLDPDAALDLLAAAADEDEASPALVVVDVKSSSDATRNFIERLKQRAPNLTVVAMAASLDRDTRNRLIDAGAAAVFERRPEIDLYRREAASIVDFWSRSERLDRTGT